MGFTTGFLSGLTLTSSILYLSLLSHARNRTTQSHLLRQQTIVLSSLVEAPVPASDTSSSLIYDRSSRGRWMDNNAGLVETAKGMWNEEVEKGVRWVERVDWAEVIRDGTARVREGARRLGSKADGVSGEGKGR